MQLRNALPSANEKFIQHVRNEIPAWEEQLPSAENRMLSEDFDMKPLGAFNNMHESIGEAIRKPGMPKKIIVGLNKLQEMLEDTSTKYLRKGKYDRKKIQTQITEIKDMATEFSVHLPQKRPETGHRK